MQSNANRLRKRLEKKAKRQEQYRHIDTKNIRVTLTMGVIMHRCDILFPDGNKFRLTIHKIGDVLVLAQPRLDVYTQEKMAVLEHLSDLVFFNDNYVIIEQNDFQTYSLKSQVGYIDQVNTTVVSISPELMNEDDYEGYDVNIISKQAKNFKFPVDEYTR